MLHLNLYVNISKIDNEESTAFAPSRKSSSRSKRRASSARWPPNGEQHVLSRGEGFRGSPPVGYLRLVRLEFLEAVKSLSQTCIDQIKEGRKKSKLKRIEVK